jgi:hypothetical protein
VFRFRLAPMESVLVPRDSRTSTTVCARTMAQETWRVVGSPEHAYSESKR